MKLAVRGSAESYNPAMPDFRVLEEHLSAQEEAVAKISYHLAVAFVKQTCHRGV